VIDSEQRMQLAMVDRLAGGFGSDELAEPDEVGLLDTIRRQFGDDLSRMTRASNTSSSRLVHEADTSPTRR